MKYSLPRGTKDILPDETPLWQFIEETCRHTFSDYNYGEIRTPIFESTDLFARSIGEETDIVSKEMYTFLDRKGRSLTLRPEETAPVVRSALENNLIGADKLTKLYYIGPMFRYERPQAGRFRQFHQAGVEAFGSADPMLDVEVIQLGLELFRRIGLPDLEVDINSVGCKKCRPYFLKAIKSHLINHIDEMCVDCKERFEKNPLRVLDCKIEGCQKYIKTLPVSEETLCAECQTHFGRFTALLKEFNIPFKVNNRLVRGLDYYTKTTFEIVSSKLGAQNAVCGGGRYDDLVEELGGPSIPAIGFAMGIERIAELKSQVVSHKSKNHELVLFIATIGEQAKKKAFELAAEIRAKGISVELDYLEKSLKSQMKLADKLGAKFVYVIGEEELAKGAGSLKNMGEGRQEEVLFNILSDKLSPE